MPIDIMAAKRYMAQGIAGARSGDFDQMFSQIGKGLDRVRDLIPEITRLEKESPEIASNIAKAAVTKNMDIVNEAMAAKAAWDMAANDIVKAAFILSNQAIGISALGLALRDLGLTTDGNTADMTVNQINRFYDQVLTRIINKHDKQRQASIDMARSLDGEFRRSGVDPNNYLDARRPWIVLLAADKVVKPTAAEVAARRTEFSPEALAAATKEGVQVGMSALPIAILIPMIWGVVIVIGVISAGLALGPIVSDLTGNTRAKLSAMSRMEEKRKEYVDARVAEGATVLLANQEYDARVKEEIRQASGGEIPWGWIAAGAGAIAAVVFVAPLLTKKTP